MSKYISWRYEDVKRLQEQKAQIIIVLDGKKVKENEKN